MIVTSLTFQDFRNYPRRSIAFSPTTTILVGPNASGKTNIIEALHVLSTGKSFRADSDQEMIAFGSEMARVKGEINPLTNKTVHDNERKELEIVLTSGAVHSIKTQKKRYLVNGVAKRSIDFSGNVRTVLFWPQHLDLVTDSPSIRRRYLDSVLIQVDREYQRVIQAYDKAIRQRNRLLEMIRENIASRNQLVYWDNLLIQSGSYITTKRSEYIDFVNMHPVSNFPSYQLAHDASIISKERLLQYKDQEIAAGVTLVGPHRDDIEIYMETEKKKRNIAKFGSRGEQRLAVLWLAVCELMFIEEKTRDKPILLLDDIFSELDEKHRALIFHIIGRQQTIITTTDKHSIETELLRKSAVYQLP